MSKTPGRACHCCRAAGCSVPTQPVPGRGPVKDIHVMAGKGYGFITFEEVTSAQEFLEVSTACGWGTVATSGVRFRRGVLHRLQATTLLQATMNPQPSSTHSHTPHFPPKNECRGMSMISMAEWQKPRPRFPRTRAAVACPRRCEPGGCVHGGDAEGGAPPRNLGRCGAWCGRLSSWGSGAHPRRPLRPAWADAASRAHPALTARFP